MPSFYLKSLTDAVTAMHGCKCTHVATARVIETMEGQVVWDGNVETMALIGHPKAAHAYAWGYKDADGEVQYIAVLSIPPINSPREAVQAAIASGTQK